MENKSGQSIGNELSVGIVVTCFNEGDWLIEAVDSIPERWRSRDSLVVVNDGSEHQPTLSALLEVKARGIHVIDQNNQGVSSARNVGWKHLQTDVILFLDADNRIGKEYLVEGAAAFSDPGVGVVYSFRKEIGNRDRVVEQPEVSPASLMVGNRVDACALVRRELLVMLGGFDESMRSGYEDWELWIRVAHSNFTFYRICRPLFEYRVRDGSLMAQVLDPEKRARTVTYVLGKHEDKYQNAWRDVISQLHRIQVFDYNSLEQALTEVNVLRKRESDGRAREENLQLELTVAKADVRDREAQLKGLRQEREVQVAGMQMELDQSVQDKDRAVARALELQKEIQEISQALELHKVHGQSLQKLVQSYERRIQEFENTKYWRFKKSYFKMIALLRTSSDSSSNRMRWLKRGLFLVSQKGRRIVRRFLAKVFRTLYLITEERNVRILVGEEQVHSAVHVPGDRYHEWMVKNMPRVSDLRDMAKDQRSFGYRPLVSVLMPVYNPPIDLLEKAIRSVQDQVYENWELCIADDCSPDPEVRHKLKEIALNDDRVRLEFRQENGHISKASNSALSLVKGEFIALMDHDDLLSPDALYQVVKELNRDSAIDLIYSDEDKVSESNVHSDPHFKPQWCPDHLLSRNYFGHLVVLRTSIVQDIGGFREGFEGSQDYDLVLRFTEQTSNIVHIPKVLYHWRIHEASAAKGEDVKPYAYHAAKRALTEALERRGEPGEVEFLEGFRGYRIKFKEGASEKVSVIIPTRDKADILQVCLESIFRLTDHPDFEVIVISNNSKEKDLFQLMERMEREYPDRFKWYELNEPFNFSALMNFGVSRSNGDQLLFLNNDTEVIQADWMTIMCSWSARPQTGAVGVKLLYHNNTIQHAGVIIGLGGVAGHTFVGYPRMGPGYFNYINTVNNYSAVTAACVMVARWKFDKVGGFDELFTVEYNDVDLCLKIQAAGFHNVYVPDVELYHYESLTRGHPHMTKESYERHLREVALFLEKWQHVVDDDPCYNPNLQRGVHDFQFAT
jgi:glycosyltransferase involved in cell wall biosynthesis